MLRNLRSRRSLGNPLVRRVQRHASITSLFRAPEERMLVETPSQPPAAGMGGIFPRVSASFTPDVPSSDLSPDAPFTAPEQAQPVSAVQTSTALDAPLPAGTVSSPRPVASVHAVPGSAIPGSAGPAFPPVQASAVQRRPLTPAALPPQTVAGEVPVAEPKTDDDDTIWRRLQTIFRRHQEKRAAEQQTAPGIEPITDQTAAENVPAGKAPATTTAPAVTAPASAADVSPGKSSPSNPPGLQKAEETSVSKASLPEKPPLRLPRAIVQEFPAEAKPVQLPELHVPQPEIPAQSPRPAAASAAVPPIPVPSLDEVEISDHSLGSPSIVGQSEDVKPPVTPPARAEQPVAGDLEDTLIARPQATPQIELPSIASSAAAQPSGPVPPSAPQGAPQSAPQGAPQGAPQVAPQGAPQGAPDMASEPEIPAIVSPAPAASIAADMGRRQLPEPEPESELSLPLQEVWPVERLDQPALLGEAGARAAPEIDLPPPDPALASAPEARHVQRLLQEVSPGQPTDSHVELITPRRPRPAARAEPAVQRLPAESREQTPPIPDLEPPGLPLADFPDQPRQASAAPVYMTETAAPIPSSPAPSQPKSGAPSLVPTSIGPLPSDLWGLIGEQPPAPLESSPAVDLVAPGLPSAVQPARQPVPPSIPAPQSRSQVPAAETLHPPAAHRPDLLAPSPEPVRIVQLARQEASESGAAGGGTETDSDAARTEGGADAAGNVDVDELTKRVYAEIKRRLAAEWERMRRKF